MNEPAGTYARRLPLVADRDRLAAAVLAASRLADKMRHRAPAWQVWYSSDGAIISTRRDAA